jgi:hypothetical protein
MGNKKREIRPCVDNLEARVAMSAGPVEVTLVSAATTRTTVAGSLSGKYLATGQDNRPADQPYEVAVEATGRIHGLGRVTMTGSLAFGGFRPRNEPDVTGTLTLTNVRGSVTIRLTGFGGNGQIPNRRFGLDALIINGTGAYTNLRGLGKATVLFGKNIVRSITTPSPIGGTLTLNLNLRPPVR